MAVANRPDLRSAETAIEKAKADNRLAIANGTADPVVVRLVLAESVIQ